MKNVFIETGLLETKEIKQLIRLAEMDWTVKRKALWISAEQENNECEQLLKKLANKILGSVINRYDVKKKQGLGLELWININNQHSLHCDCDEVLREKTGLMRYPICSTVYYLKVPKNGGELIIFEQASHENIAKIYEGMEDTRSLGESTTIKPKVDELIIFGSKMPHYVNPWEPKMQRISIAANIWLDRPIDPEKPFEYLLKVFLNKAEKKLFIKRKIWKK